MMATVFEIQRNSFVDGPGIRTTVFFKGCNLKCQWCHSPESQNSEKEFLFYSKRCAGCGKCADVSVEDSDFFCIHNAKEICGKEYSIEEIFETVSCDKIFYETSGGGVTFSGGECMLQIDFLAEILKKCRENGIHTAVDTAGNIPWESFEKIVPYTDLFLYDIKVMDNEKHRQYTGVENVLILKNLAKLLKSDNSVWIRVPIIPGVNDTEEEMKKIKNFFDENGYPEKIQLLPYHSMGEYKYDALDRKAKKFNIPDDGKTYKLKSVIGKEYF